jgi:hypothetical protein
MNEIQDKCYGKIVFGPNIYERNGCGCLSCTTFLVSHQALEIMPRVRYLTPSRLSHQEPGSGAVHVADRPEFPVGPTLIPERDPASGNSGHGQRGRTGHPFRLRRDNYGTSKRGRARRRHILVRLGA